MAESMDLPETPEKGPESPSKEHNYSPAELIMQAADACTAGDLRLGLHLYLAAYERSTLDGRQPSRVAERALRKAWSLACDLRERSMAEYVFEKMEPFLTPEECADCTDQLQELALDRLEKFGFSRQELADVAEMIAADFLDGEGVPVQMEHISLPHAEVNVMGFVRTEVDEEGEGMAEAPEAPVAVAGAEAEAPVAVAGAEAEAPTGAAGETGETPGAAEAAAASADAPGTAPQGVPAISLVPSFPDFATALQPLKQAAQAAQKAQQAEQALVPEKSARPDKLTYRTVVGYDRAVSAMRSFGVGMQEEPGFLEFVSMLNRRHGLDRAPALDTFVIQAAAREDAMRFAEATIGELGLPALRMSVEEGPQGMPVLCVTTQSNNRPRMNQQRNRFAGPGILLLEDLDLWAIPSMPESMDGLGGFILANVSRGAREALDLVHSAVEDPDVYVLATMADEGQVEPFFRDLLEPVSVVHIDFPDEKERSDIWEEIMRDHPSMRTLNRVDLMRYSAGMPRYDMYMAAREAVEEAWRAGMERRTYRPVSPQNIFDKLAAYQPIDSDEYRALEEEVVRSFQQDLEDLDEFLNGLSR